jgi:hypothetical protein
MVQMSFHRSFGQDSTDSEMRVAVERRQGTWVSRTVACHPSVRLGHGEGLGDTVSLRCAPRITPARATMIEGESAL